MARFDEDVGYRFFLMIPALGKSWTPSCSKNDIALMFIRARSMIYQIMAG